MTETTRSDNTPSDVYPLAEPDWRDTEATTRSRVRRNLRNADLSPTQFTLRDLFAVITAACVLLALAARFLSNRQDAWLGLAILLISVTAATWLVDRLAYR